MGMTHGASNFVRLASAAKSKAEEEECKVYTVKVVDAQDLVKEDADIKLLFWTVTNNNDPYVEINAYYGADGVVGDANQMVRTSTKDNTVHPIWNEEFEFDEDTLYGLEYTAFRFTIYDDEVIGINGADYLGITDYVSTDDLDCDEVFAMDLDVDRGGSLFVEISMDCSCDSSSSEDDDEED